MRKYILLLMLLCLHGMARGQTEAEYQYWFDTDYSSLHTTQASETWEMTIDVSDLKEGLHSAHFQLKSSNGDLSPVVTKTFYKISASETVNSFTCWFDDDFTNAQSLTNTGGAIQLDIQGIKDGLHVLHVMPKGTTSSPVHSVLYMKTITAENVDYLRCVFSVDNKVVQEERVNVADRQATWDIDVADIDDGVHFLNLIAYTPSGAVASTKSAVFVKEPLGGRGISKYGYTVNGQTIENLSAIENNPKNFTLMSLLPVPTMPIRSSKFHFEVKDGEPAIYAKNDVLLYFADNAGYSVIDQKEYVDYQVKESLTDIPTLPSGIPQTVAKPTKDAITWYKLDAEPGDSLQFMLDRASSIQLFSPSGEEVYSTSGSESVKWGGCHVRESGTYYFALHDVTAPYGNTVKISYNHIDKYAVLRQDVKVVGNGGCSTITFEGNGFRDLYAIDLYNEAGDSIHHVYIGHESDATTSVVFDFTNATIGKYHALFRFAEEDKVLCRFLGEEDKIFADLRDTKKLINNTRPTR